MFNLLRLLQIRVIKYQIKVFLDWRNKQGLSSPGYEKWLNLFLKKTGITNVLDIRAEDIERFIQYVADNSKGRYPVLEAERSLRQFIKFYSARGKMSGTVAEYRNSRYSNGVQFLANTKRNRELVQRRLKDPRKWSYRRLGDYYGLHFTTVRQIFQRDVKRYTG